MVDLAQGPYEFIEQLFFDASEASYNTPTLKSDALKLVMLALTSADQMLQEVVLWMIGNCCSENSKITDFMVNIAKLINHINTISQVH